MMNYLWQHRTKALGFLQITLGVLAAADGLFTPFGLKILLLANALSTAWLGFFNSAQIRKSPPP